MNHMVSKTVLAMTFGLVHLAALAQDPAHAEKPESIQPPMSSE